MSKFVGCREAGLRGKIIALDTYIRIEEISKVSSLSFHFRKPEKEEQIKSQIRRRKEIITFRVEINELKTGSQRRKAMKPKADFLKR